MRPEVLKYLHDIDFSLKRITFHMQGISSFAVFKQSWTVYDAIERRLAIIGEAIWQIDKLDKSIMLTDKKRIIGLRYILTHDYDVVSADILWKIVNNNIPLLETEIKKLISAHN